MNQYDKMMEEMTNPEHAAENAVMRQYIEQSLNYHMAQAINKGEFPRTEWYGYKQDDYKKFCEK